MAPRRRADCQICNVTESKYICAKCGILYCSVTCYKEHKSATCTEIRAENSTPSGPEFETSPSAGITQRGGDGPACVRPPHGDPSGSATTGSAEVGHPSALLLRPTSESADNDAPRLGSSGARKPDSQGPSDPLEGDFLTSVNLDTGTVPGEDKTNKGDSGEEEFLRDPNPLGEGEPPDSRPLRKLTSLKWPYVPDEPSYPDPLKRDDPKPLSLNQYEAIATSPGVRQVLSSHPRLKDLLRTLDRLRGPEREKELERVLGVTPSHATGFALAGLPASSPYLKNNDAGRVRTTDMDEEDMNALRELAEAVESVVRGERRDLLGLDWEAMAS